MSGFARSVSRRSLLFAGAAAGRLLADGQKGAAFPSDSERYPDPATELDVYRLTKPDYSSTMTAYYNRGIARNSGWMLFCCDRNGSPQGFRIDLKTGDARQLTEVESLDGSSLTLLPDNRSFCYFAARSLYLANLTSLREREVYQVPEGWERCPGMSVGPDGTHATFAERRGDGSRLRMVPLLQAAVQGPARTVIEAPFAIGDPVPRPMRAQILYRQAEEALWLVNSDGAQNHKLKLAPGRVGPANWASDGKTVLYLSFPDDAKQLNTVRESTPDSNTEKLVCKTSQFVHFGANRDTSVFVGASRNAASPTVLLLLRVTQRERTICEHKASHPENVAPIFSPDSQRIYFQSDRHGKPAIYCMHVEHLVEKTESN
ncbi:MAG TPA: oligogalacturonate lyase family protein [Candidatus Solibacter sp.]|nr:oligogalacturonate lyase family protein [Candidatus Solibacter sp.]